MRGKSLTLPTNPINNTYEIYDRPTLTENMRKGTLASTTSSFRTAHPSRNHHRTTCLRQVEVEEVEGRVGASS